MLELCRGQSYLKVMTDMFKPRFLLAALHIEAILRGTTISRRKRTLKSIKDGVGLGDAYGATLERITAQDEEKAKLAMATLTWVCYSERPLQVDELCHALAVEVGEADFDPENVPSIGTLLDCCQGLITVDAEASTVRLIHYTVQEYLCSHPDLFSKPHSILAETCLTYLNSQQVTNLTSHSSPDTQSMPFLKYSARYWGTHTNRDLSDSAKALALVLLNQYEDHISAVSLLEQELHPSYIGHIRTSPLFSRLHCASFFGIVELVTILINAEGLEVDQQDCVGRTPLTWAANNGHEGVVKILLELKDVDPNRPDKSDLTPLAYASIEGHEGVVKLLLERDNVDANRTAKYNRTPLGWAALRGHDGVVKLLLERKDVDADHPDVYNQTPLRNAAAKGHERVVKLLLERDNVDPNRTDKNDRTPLVCAAIWGHEEAVKLMLERDNVDPNRPDKNGRTPLGWAAIEGHDGVVKLLLERKDVDPDHPDVYNQTPLRNAAVKGHEGVVKVLLERDNVDPNRTDKNDRTPLVCAAIGGHEEVVKFLLERGDIDSNCPDKHGGTPLSYATREGYGTIVQLLQARKSIQTPDTPIPYPL